MKTILKTTAISAILLILALGLISCRETVSEQMDIIIQNDTGKPIYVVVFPIKELLGGYDPWNHTWYYRKCFECSGYNSTHFRLPLIDDVPNFPLCAMIFHTGDINILPHRLALKAFDSIHIRLADENEPRIRFTHEKVIGFSQNIFSENSEWAFQMGEIEYPGIRPERVKLHQHIFVISEP